MEESVKLIQGLKVKEKLETSPENFLLWDVGKNDGLKENIEPAD